MKLSLTFFILMISILFAVGQTGEEVLSLSVEEVIEEIVAEAGEDVDLTVLLEDLYFYADNPIPLNAATRSQLEKLPFLSQGQIEELIAYPDLNGRFLSLYELGLLSTFDRQTIIRLQPFVTLEKQADVPTKLNLPSVFRYGRHQVLMRYQQVLDEQQGFSSASDSLLEVSPNSRYLGSQPKLYARYQFKYRDHISVGFTAEKDAGEEFFRGSQKQGFDFYSGHAFYQNVGFVKQLALGDFHARFGQGLILWSGYSFGKSLDNIATIERIGQGIRPYTSTDENNLFRGGAITLGKNRWTFTALYSNKKIDGNKLMGDTIANQEEYIISSLQTSGLHSTPGEMSDRKSLEEEIIGSSLQYSANKAKISLNYAYKRYGTEIHFSERLDNQFGFNGTELSNLSLAYRFRLWRLNLFGETATNDEQAIATINGLSVNLSSSASMVLVHRNYPRDYYAVKPNSYGDKDGTNNEIGTYLALEFSPISEIRLTSWFDNYQFPWMRYQVDAPSRGHEYAVQISYFQSYDFSAYLRYRAEHSETKLADTESSVSKLQDWEKHNVRFHVQYSLSEGITLKNRVEYTHIRDVDGCSDGWLAYQDVAYTFSRMPLKLYFRYALFDTQGWDARMYAYENDVLYAFSVPAIYDKGTRSYLLAKYSLGKNLDAWVRFAKTHYSKKDLIGSGLTQINGNSKSEIKVMLRIRF